MGIVDISFQRAATGKCATPTTHLIRQFDYLAATHELFPLAESKTIAYLLVWAQPWFHGSIVLVNSACFTSVNKVLCAAMTRLLRWRASNVTQPCNNWRCGFRFTALERPSRSCRGHPWCHATCLVPRLFLGLYWPRSELSATLYVLRTMTMPTANLGEIPCYFSGRLRNQLNDFSRNGLRIQLLH